MEQFSFLPSRALLSSKELNDNFCVLKKVLRPMAGFWSFHSKSRASLTAHQPSPSQETAY